MFDGSRFAPEPLTQAERDDLRAFYRTLRDKSGLKHEEAMRDSIVRLLMSPKFAYRTDLLPEADRKTAVQPLSGYALASRLSYFLWSSMPDDELLDAAERGELATPDDIRAQAERMLADPKAQALVDRFAGQWLHTRLLADHLPDYAAFPAYDEALRDAFAEETLRLFREPLAGEVPVTDLLTKWANPVVVEVIAAFSVMTHYEGFQRGVLDLRDVVFFASLIGFALFTTGVIIRNDHSSQYASSPKRSVSRCKRLEARSRSVSPLSRGGGAFAVRLLWHVHVYAR